MTDAEFDALDQMADRVLAEVGELKKTLAGLRERASAKPSAEGEVRLALGAYHTKELVDKMLKGATFEQDEDNIIVTYANGSVECFEKVSYVTSSYIEEAP